MAERNVLRRITRDLDQRADRLRPPEDLEKKFVAEAVEKDLSGLNGHRSVGGCRASVYNAMPVAGVKALTEFMAAFQENNA